VANSEADLFEQHAPEIIEADATDAAKAKRIVQSFNCQPIVVNETGTIQALAIKWKFSSGQTETILIGQYAALILRQMFSHLEENKWTELATLPPGATPQ
jgi:hypothetical protein